MKNYINCFVCSILFSFISLKSYANWLCKEASSKANGNTFYACGHAKEKTLTLARSRSLEAAKDEFRSFCNESEFCKDQAYNISPMRTDCSEKDNIYSCYRGLEFTILPEKKKNKFINKAEISDLINEREKELRVLNEEINNLEKIKQLDEKIEELKNADSKEAELEYLKHASSDYSSTARTNAFSFLILGVGIPTKNRTIPESKSVFLPSIGAEYNRIIWQRYSFRLQFSLIGSLENEDEIKKSLDETIYHSYHGLDLNIGVPIQTSFGYIIPNAGKINIKYKSTRNTLNQLGLINTNESKLNYNSNYYGAGFRFGNKYFIEFSPRYFDYNKKVYGTVSVGINIGY